MHKNDIGAAGSENFLCRISRYTLGALVPVKNCPMHVYKVDAFMYMVKELLVEGIAEVHGSL
ncbi:MAG TPA: hypothetical protein VLH56_10920 [Dissulfurispiraceae bacterium]|nr:hypothetical protein [Dissulfurispiraceae bacterium]